MIHELKTVPEYFQEVWDGKKDFEVRSNDRDFKLDDTLRLREYNIDTETYTGRSITKKVKYILDNPQYVKEGYVIMGIKGVGE